MNDEASNYWLLVWSGKWFLRSRKIMILKQVVPWIWTDTD